MSELTGNDISNALRFCVDLGYTDDKLVGSIANVPSSRLVVPGLADVVVAHVTRLGQREKYPRPYDWENLLPILEEGKELLWITTKERSRFRCYLAVKQNVDILPSRYTVLNRLKDYRALADHFARRAFPESRLRQLGIQDTDDLFSLLGKNSTTLVCGAPSPKAIETDVHFEERDADRRPYASLNDALEPFLSEDFSIVFSLCKATPAEVRDRLRILTEIRSHIHPHITGEVAETEGKQKGGQKEKVEGENIAEGQQEQRNVLSRIVQFFTGANKGQGKVRGASVNYSVNKTSSTTSGENWSHNESVAYTAERLDAWLELTDKALELQVEHLVQAAASGGYYGAVTVHVNDSSVGMRIGRAIAGSLSGSHSHVRPFQVIPYEGPGSESALHRNVALKDVFPGIPLLNTQQACQLLMLPDAEVPDLKLKRSVFYGRSQSREVFQPTGAPSVFLGKSAFLEPAVEFRNSRMAVSAIEPEEREVRIPAEDLLSHLLITGTTGSGKTIRAAGILNRLPPEHFRVLVIETAKKTFRHRLREGGLSPVVYALGGHGGKPFRINPFYFDPSTSLKRHISVLSDALSELLPVEALIGPKLREAILECYADKNWNIERGVFEGSGPPRYPTMIDFNSQVERICSALKYSTELNQNYMGALLGRARLFIDDLYQDIFAFGGNQTFDQLFGGDTVLELDDLPPSEIQMPAFIISLVLERLRSHRARLREENGGVAPQPYHVVLVEEAHNILGRQQQATKSDREANGAKHLVDQLARLLQEGRELGIAVIVVDQSPSSLAEAVLKNTNTKLVHRLVDGSEIEVVGKAIGLEEDEWSDLMSLEDGECVVRTKGTGKPIRLSPLELDAPPHGEATADISDSPPNYWRAQRVLDDFRAAPTLVGLARTVDQLTEICDSDLELINYMVGKHRAWRNLMSVENAWRNAESIEELPDLLRPLIPGRLSETRELQAFLYASLSGVDASSLATRLAGSHFDRDWFSRNTAVLNGCIARIARRQGVDEDVVQDAASALKHWANDWSQDGPSAAANDVLRLRLLAPGIRETLEEALTSFQTGSVSPDGGDASGVCVTDERKR